MELYAPLLERDLGAIPAAVAAFREQHTSDELFLAVARFAVMAFAPSQHAKHAMLAVLAAHDLREECGDSWDELLTQCAVYAAQSRQPWSEPPIMDPPSGEGAPGSLSDATDRLSAERWLAAHLDDPGEILRVAAEDRDDFGHKLIVADAAFRLAEMLGEKGRYVALRTAVWEWVAYAGARVAPVEPSAALLDRLIDRCVAERGSIESAHEVFHFAAAHGGSASGRGEAPPIYALARDYGQCLKAHAVAKRLRRSFPAARLEEFVAACRMNLEQAPSFEEWSFA